MYIGRHTAFDVVTSSFISKIKAECRRSQMRHAFYSFTLRISGSLFRFSSPWTRASSSSLCFDTALLSQKEPRRRTMITTDAIVDGNSLLTFNFPSLCCWYPFNYLMGLLLCREKTGQLGWGGGAGVARGRRYFNSVASGITNQGQFNNPRGCGRRMIYN